MKPRQQTPAALLARIQGHDFASHSDAELRYAFTRLQSRASEATPDNLLPECFAIVAEAIDRRLGVWRLFDAESSPGSRCREAGRANTEAITQAAAEVARQRAHRRQGEISLPAGFYQAARRQDAAGRMRFRPTDEQLLAGIHLFRGRVAQMDAGEGKTVAAAFPAALHALMGRPVQVVTANDYLAGRDAKLLEPVYESLGLSVGAVLQHTEEGERRHIYRRAIVYSAMRELGFDFLRDNLKSDPAQRVQRESGLSGAVAIVDEADHALIDEAFTPMIISGNPAGSSRAAIRADRAVAQMIRRQRQVVRELAAGLDSPGAKAGDQIQALALLLLAEPLSGSEGHPALQRPSHGVAAPGAAHPRNLKRAWALVEDHSPEVTSGLYYAVHPGSRFVTLTEKGRDYLEQQLGLFYDGGGSHSTTARSTTARSTTARSTTARSTTAHSTTARSTTARSTTARSTTAHSTTAHSTTDGGSPPPERSLPLAESRRRAGRVARSLSRRYGLGNQILQSLRAHLLLKRGVDYLVDGDGVTLIDQHTGRPKPDNIYQHGLQAAVEAKEGVTVRPESETLAWISVAGFVSRYWRVCGITGTAALAAGEFRRKYGLEVAAIPPVNPPMRVNCPPKVFLTQQDKIAAVVDEVASRHRMGQPVLAAARTVEQSEELSRELARREIPHQLLNAVTTHAEARIVRDAGRFGAVTISTPMAGRGTDIILEPRLNHRLAQRCADEIHRLLTGEAGVVEVHCPSPGQVSVLRDELERAGPFHTADAPDGALRITLRRLSHGSEIQRLEFALGLCVIGSEVYDSRRVELQLLGRSGRQGEFGLAQTFLSLEDRLIHLDAEGILKLSASRQTDTAGRVCYTGREVARRIERLQAAADRESEAQRSLMQDYAAEFDRQTNLYCRLRQKIIFAAERDYAPIMDLCRETAQRVALRLAAQRLDPDADGAYRQRFTLLAEEARLDYGVDCSALYGADLTLLPAELSALFVARLEQQTNRTGQRAFPRLARLLWLQVCGELWPGHIAGLRDSMASQLLSTLGHKSAVAQYIRRSNEAWREYWELVDAEFLSRLIAFPLSAPPEAPPIAVSRETELLLSQELPSRSG